MIEGGGSRNYLFTKKMMYSAPAAWNELMRKLVAVTAEYSAEQVRAGADTIQIFDSWVGCLSVEDYRRYVLPHVTDLVKRLQKTGAPVIYFGTDSSTLLPSMQETGAEVIGLDWRIPLDTGWQSLGFKGAVQGNLDPVLLFADWKELKSRAEDILRQAGGRPGHIFNLGHGILPGNSGGERESALRFHPRALGRVQEGAQDGVKRNDGRAPLGLCRAVLLRNRVSSFAAVGRSLGTSAKTAVLLLAHGSPENPDQVPEFLSYVTGGRPLPPAVVEEIRHRYSLIGFSPLACWTLLQADQLSRSLQMPVFVGMRNWKPFIADAVKAIAVGQYERVIAVCLAPQNSRTSVGLYRSAVVRRRKSSFQHGVRRGVARSAAAR